MIIASCRKKFVSNSRMSRRLQLRVYPDPTRPESCRRLTLEDLKFRARDQHVCIMVHGFNNPLAKVLRAYAELEAEMARTGVAGPKGYGLVVGFAWPGWTSGPGFLLARTSAERAGRHLRRLVNHLRPVACTVDIQTHSLGARVALAALRPPRGVYLNHLLLTAPAVDCDILEPGREFHPALAACSRCLVYHSRHDRILRKSFPIGDLADGIKKALGLTGPRHRATVLKTCPNLYVVDCTRCVPDHHGYRHARPVYAHWRRVLSGDALQRCEKL